MILGLHSGGHPVSALPFQSSIEDFRQENRDLEVLELPRLFLATARSARELDRDKIAQSADGHRYCLFGGEFWFREQLIADLERAGREAPVNATLAQLALIGWETFGLDVISRLRGTFALALYDSVSDTLVLANDRFGMHPLYVLETGEAVLFSSEAEPLAAYGGYTKQLDHQAVAEYFTLELPLGGRTLFEGIRNLPPGTIAERRRNGPLVFTRSCRNDIAIDRSTTLDEFADRVAEMLRTGFRERLKGRAEVECALTGGMDSRLFVGLIDDDIRDNVLFRTRSVPYFAGTDPEPEIAIVQMLVEKFRLRHRFDGDAQDRLIGRAFLARSRRLVSRYKFEGHFGDNVFGGRYLEGARAVQRAARGEPRARELRDQIFSTSVATTFDPIESAATHRAATDAENGDLLFMALASMHGFLTHLTRGSAAGWVDPPRWIALNVDYFLRDPDLFCLLLSIPPEFLANRLFYDRLYERCFPDLCTVPSTRKTGVVELAPRPNPRKPFTREMYARDLAEFIDSPQTWDKGIYNEPFLRPLLTDGFDLTITPAFVDFESWYRFRFLNEPWTPAHAPRT